MLWDFLPMRQGKSWRGGNPASGADGLHQAGTKKGPVHADGVNSAAEAVHRTSVRWHSEPSLAIDGIIDRFAAAQRRQALRLRRTRWRGLRGLTAPRCREEGIDAVNGLPCLSLAVG